MKMNTRIGLPIDPHTHCRGQGWKYKCDIVDILELAGKEGLGAIFDMPNNNPLTIDRKSVADRLALIPEDSPVEYYMYVGLTSDADQIKEAIWCYENFPQVIGLKMFAGHSIGPMAVVEELDQQRVYRTLAGLGYKGVIAVHCEKESLLIPELWNPAIPTTHALARPKIAEIRSIVDQFSFASEAGFQGTLHICHISCAESVEVVKMAKKKIKISCGATPHHLLYSTTTQEALLSLGNLLKMNPPLRTKDDSRDLMRYMLNGDIDWIESDQARHTMHEKLSHPYLSGVDALYLYNDLKDNLAMDLSPDRMDQLTRRNIIEAFSPKIDHLKNW